MGPGHEHLLRRLLRPGPRDLHLPPQQLLSPSRQGPHRLRPVPWLPLHLLRRRHSRQPLRRALSLLTRLRRRRWRTAPDRSCSAAGVGQDRGVRGGAGGAAVAGRGGGEEDREGGDEDGGESVQFHGVVLWGGGSKLVVPIDILDRCPLLAPLTD